MEAEHLADDSETPARLAPLFRGTTHSIGLQFLRYLVVGGIAFSVDFALLVGLTELLGVQYLVSAVGGFGAGLTVNYILSIHWVFAVRRSRDRRGEFTLFAMIGVIGLALTELILYLGTDMIGMDYRASKLIAVAVVLLWNFSARRYLLTGRHRSAA